MDSPLLQSIVNRKAMKLVAHMGIQPAFYFRYKNTLIPIHFDHRFSKRLWSFLRQIVTNAAGDGFMRIFAGEFLAIRGRVRMWRAVGIALKRNGGHSDGRTFRQPLFKVIVFL